MADEITTTPSETSSSSAPPNDAPLFSQVAAQEAQAQAAGGATEAPAAAPAAPVAPPPWYKDQLKQYGLPEFADEGQAVEYLAGAYRQAQQYAPYAQDYNRLYQEYQRLLQAQQAAKPPEPKRWYEPPKYDPGWERMLRRNPQTGELEGPPDILSQYNLARQQMGQFVERFTLDPIGTIKPGIEEVVKPLVQQMLQEQFSQYQQQQAAQGILGQHAQWLYQTDAAGNPLMGLTGERMLSPYGQKYSEYARQAQQHGMSTVAGMNEFATSKVYNDLLFQRNQALEQLLQQHGIAVPGAAQPAAPAAPAQTSPSPYQIANEQLKQRAIAPGAVHQPSVAPPAQRPGPRPGATFRELALAELNGSN